MSRVANGCEGTPLRREHGDHRLADAERGERLLEVVEVAPREGLRRGAQRLLVVRREGAQRVLHAVPELREHVGRDVLRGLRDEEDADALRADQPHHLLDLREKGLARVVEEQVRLVEEEDQLRLVDVADLRQLVVEPREHPHHEGREERGLVLHVRQLEDAHQPAAVALDLQQVVAGRTRARRRRRGRPAARARPSCAAARRRSPSRCRRSPSDRPRRRR